MQKRYLFRWLIWVLQGILVGFGAILPGVSGGALLAAFGLYKPVLEVVSSPIQGIRKHFGKLICFGAGGVIGFVGLSGIASILLAKNAAIVTCVFMGFILGTVPELWTDAGKTLDRAKYPRHRPVDWISLFIGFVGMTILLSVLNGTAAVHIQPGFAAYILCGLFWGISFVVPGMSASTLLLFFGLYQPMLDGISRLDFGVLFPLGVGVVVILVTLPRLVNAAFARWDAVLCHGILGIVLSTTIMIFPGVPGSAAGWLIYLFCFVVGALVSWFLSVLCARLKENAGE